MSGVDPFSRPDQAIQPSVFLSRSGLETHLSGERWVAPKTRVELA